MILCRPGGSVTFFWANILILFLTTSIPLKLQERGGKTWKSWQGKKNKERCIKEFHACHLMHLALTPPPYNLFPGAHAQELIY